EEGGLVSFAAIRSLRPDGERWTLTEVAARAGIDADLALAVWRCAGFADPRRFERRFGPGDLVVFELVRDATEFVGRDHVLQLIRTAGEAIARVSEAEIALLRSKIEAPLVGTGNLAEVARGYAAVADTMFP